MDRPCSQVAEVLSTNRFLASAGFYGHSYIDRVHKSMSGMHLNPARYLEVENRLDVDIYGLSGCHTTGSLSAQLYRVICEQSPAVAVLELGINDLISGACPSTVALNLMHFAEDILHYSNVRYVILPSILEVPKANNTPLLDHIRHTNFLLHDLCSNSEGIIFVKHRPVRPKDFLDQLHPSTIQSSAYIKSLRNIAFTAITLAR